MSYVCIYDGCMSRYSREADFNDWKHNLHIYGIDLRDLKSVIRLCDRIAQSYPRVDIIVNNAAQTIRRPAAFYRHLLPNELKTPQQLQPKLRNLIEPDPHRCPHHHLYLSLSLSFSCTCLLSSVA